jgi:hypothetical protein
MAIRFSRPVAVFHYRKNRAIGRFLTSVRGIVGIIEKRSDLFPFPSPALALVRSNITALEKAQDVVQTRLRGSASKRDLKYSRVCKDINRLLAYVQGLADQAPNQLASRAIILASGFSLKGVRGKGKAFLKAIRRKVSGEVLLMAKAAGKRTIYKWQKSPDGKIWTDLTDTLGASLLVKGLTPEKLWFFRFRTVNSAGESSWSAPVNIAVY